MILSKLVTNKISSNCTRFISLNPVSIINAIDPNSVKITPITLLPKIKVVLLVGVTLIALKVFSTFSSTIFKAINIPASIDIKSIEIFTSIFLRGGTVRPNSMISLVESSTFISSS